MQWIPVSSPINSIAESDRAFPKELYRTGVSPSPIHDPPQSLKMFLRPRSFTRSLRAILLIATPFNMLTRPIHEIKISINISLSSCSSAFLDPRTHLLINCSGNSYCGFFQYEHTFPPQLSSLTHYSFAIKPVLHPYVGQNGLQIWRLESDNRRKVVRLH